MSPDGHPFLVRYPKRTSEIAPRPGWPRRSVSGHGQRAAHLVPPPASSPRTIAARPHCDTTNRSDDSDERDSSPAVISDVFGQVPDRHEHLGRNAARTLACDLVETFGHQVPSPVVAGTG